MEADAPTRDSPAPAPEQPSPTGTHAQPSSSTSALPEPLAQISAARPRPPKRRLGGKLAHQMENVKVARVDELVLHPPPVEVTPQYELSFQEASLEDRKPSSPKTYMQFDFTGLPFVPSYRGFRDEVAYQQDLARAKTPKCLNPGFPEGGSQQLTANTAAPQPQAGSSRLARTVSWLCPQPRMPPVNPGILDLLKHLRQQYRQEPELMSDEEAQITWVNLNDEERFHVLGLFSKQTAQAQIAASEAAFMSIPTSRIVAPQSAVSSQAQPHPAESVDQQPPPQTPHLSHTDAGARSAELGPGVRSSDLLERYTGSGPSGEPNQHATQQAQVAAYPPQPSLAPVAPSPPSPTPQSPESERRPTEPDVHMPDTYSATAGGGLPRLPVLSQAPQAPRSTESQPVQTFAGMNELNVDGPPLPFFGSQFDIGGTEHRSMSSQAKGKAREVDVRDTESESGEWQDARSQGRVSRAATECMSDDHGPTFTPPGAPPSGDQSGNLTGGVVSMLFNELRAMNNNLKENSDLQRRTLEALLALRPDNTPPSGSRLGSPRSSKSPERPQRRARTPVQSVRDRKLNNPSLAARKRKKRVAAKVARWRGEDDQSEIDEDIVEDEHYTRLRARVRNLFQSMLGIDDWKHSGVLFPALTEEQIEQFDNGELKCTAQDFFVDFDQSWKKFKPNRIARQVFLDHYFARVEGGAYLKNPTPAHLLTREVVGRVLDKHMPYRRKQWRESIQPLTEDKINAIKAQAAKNSRKRSIHFTRSVIVRRRGNLRHIRLWLLLEPGNMDGDEPVGGNKKKFPVQFNILRPKWASQELCNYWWSLDTDYRTLYGNPPHQRATRGNPPRDRVLPKDSLGENGIAPIGLWRNCYDQAWLNSQDACLRQELEIIDEDFDFNFEASPASPSRS